MCRVWDPVPGRARSAEDRRADGSNRPPDLGKCCERVRTRSPRKSGLAPKAPPPARQAAARVHSPLESSSTCRERSSPATHGIRNGLPGAASTRASLARRTPLLLPRYNYFSNDSSFSASVSPSLVPARRSRSRGGLYVTLDALRFVAFPARAEKLAFTEVSAARQIAGSPSSGIKK